MQPMQEVILDSAGVPRFRENSIVRFFLNHCPYDLEDISVREFPDEDREQFAQLIGYSVGEYSELPYVSDASYRLAEEAANKLMGEQKAKD